jgi:deazaflavin-dependent oxidoreductase (nitroreductase family)
MGTGAGAYERPSLFTRALMNPLMKRLQYFPVLVVGQRGSGTVQRTPIRVTELDGSRYLVSNFGESSWVRNLRAAGGGLLEMRRGVEAFSAVEVEGAERVHVMDAYRRLHGRAVAGHFVNLPSPHDHPTFRLEPARTTENQVGHRAR